ncbi:MAG: serine/threonine protein kinase, partial [Pseudomonadota bacterium]
TGTPEIQLQPLFLPAEQIIPVLDSLADCGPLDLKNIPPAGYGPDREITVSGMVADQATLGQLTTSLSVLSDDRPLDLRIEVLNPTLCLIENFLPTAPSGDISIAFRNGEKGLAQNPTGDFFVGDNPVIDVLLPNSVDDGYLTVSILDVSGKVYNLLPFIRRPDNSVAALREGQGGAKSVRITYPIGQDPAFNVDESTLGKSKVIAIHSDKPLFTEMRPTEESATGFAEALRDQSRNQDAQILSLDSRIFTQSAR